MTPLKRDWPKIYSPLVDECGLMVRMNVNKKSIEMKVSCLCAKERASEAKESSSTNARASLRTSGASDPRARVCVRAERAKEPAGERARFASGASDNKASPRP